MVSSRGWCRKLWARWSYKNFARKDCAQKIKVGEWRENYIDELASKPVEYLNPERQYRVLFDTLDQLIARYGPHGVFHVNDLYAEYAEYAAAKLKLHAQERNYHQIIIEPIAGDYSSIDAKNTLRSFGRNRYTSVHLKNIEVSFFHDGIDGKLMLSSEESRKNARAILQQLANLSDTGLYFFPTDFEGDFIPAEERILVQCGKFYAPTQHWAPVAYYFPEGGEIASNPHGNVFWIQPRLGADFFAANRNRGNEIS